METTKALKESFDENGYIFIPGFLNSTEIDDLNEKLEKFIREVVPTMASKHVFYEDNSSSSTLKQMQQLFSYDPYFLHILKGSKFEKIAEELLGEKVIGKEVEYFNKPPMVGKATPAHQDNYYFMLNPPKAVTMWMALEKVDRENGCLHYVRKSHKKGIRPHARTQTVGFSQGITDYDESDTSNEIAFPANPGDLLVHHSLTIHRADANKSMTRSRRALGLIYFAESAKEDHKAKEAYMKLLSDEMESK